jgi:hypothetical protein
MPKVIFENGHEIDVSELFVKYMEYLRNRSKFILPIHLDLYNEFLNHYTNKPTKEQIMSTLRNKLELLSTKVEKADWHNAPFKEILAILIEAGERVWVIATDEENETIAVTHCPHMALKYVKRFNNYSQPIYLQDYDSYEEAYKIALSMNENRKLCYS